MLLPNVCLYSLLVMKLHPFPLFLLLYFALNSSVPGIGFSFFKKGVYLIGFSCAFSFKESIHFGTSRNNNTVEKQPESTQGEFCCNFPMPWKIDGETNVFHIL